MIQNQEFNPAGPKINREGLQVSRLPSSITSNLQLPCSQANSFSASLASRLEWRYFLCVSTDLEPSFQA